MFSMATKDARFLGLEDSDANPNEASCIILPAPYERTSSYGWGSEAGPRAILDASQQLETFDNVLNCEPYKLCNGISTALPLRFPKDEKSSESIARVRRAVSYWLDEKKFIIALGGEHTSALGSIIAHHDEFEDLTVLQFDAHSDLRDRYENSSFNHACVMRRVHGHNIRFIQIGIRSQAIEERAFQEENEIPVFTARYIHEKSAQSQHSWIHEIIALTGNNVYVTFDCDVLDPAIMPSTGTPEPDGLNWNQITAFFEALSQWRNLVGIDFTELAPIEGLHHPQFTIAKLIQRVIGLKFSVTNGENHLDKTHLQPSSVLT
jgi:agmatinase